MRAVSQHTMWNELRLLLIENCLSGTFTCNNLRQNLSRLIASTIFFYRIPNYGCRKLTREITLSNRIWVLWKGQKKKKREWNNFQIQRWMILSSSNNSEASLCEQFFFTKEHFAYYPALCIFLVVDVGLLFADRGKKRCKFHKGRKKKLHYENSTKLNHDVFEKLLWNCFFLLSSRCKLHAVRTTCSLRISSIITHDTLKGWKILYHTQKKIVSCSVAKRWFEIILVEMIDDANS